MSIKMTYYSNSCRFVKTTNQQSSADPFDSLALTHMLHLF